MQRLIVLSIYLVVCLWGATTMAAPSVILNDFETGYPLGEFVEVLEDSTGELTIDEVSSKSYDGSFVESKQKIPNFGFTDSVYWIRMNLLYVPREQWLEKEWYIEIDYPLIDRVQIFERDVAGDFKQTNLGDDYHFYLRQVKYTNLVHPVTTLPQQSKTIYMRVKTSMGLQLPIRIWSSTGLIEQVNTRQITVGVYYGGALMLLAACAYLFVVFNRQVYLYLIGYLLCLLLTMLAFDGLAFEYLWPFSPWWANRAVTFWGGLSCFWMTQLPRLFLRVEGQEGYFPNWSERAAVLAIIVSVLSFILNYNWSILMMFVLMGGITILQMFGAVRYWRLDPPRMRLFLLGHLLFITGIVVSWFVLNGHLPASGICQCAMHIGVSLQALIYCYVLVERLSLEKRASNHPE